MQPQQSEAPQLSIVIVSWNGWADLEICLDSIRASEFQDVEVIVVENGSVDGTRERLPEKYPEVTIVQNEENVGHGPGVNQGLKVARGKYTLILDSDAQLDPAASRILVAYMEAHPEVGVLAPRIYSLDGNIEESARNFPTPMAGLFGRQSILTSLFPNNRFSRRYLARENIDKSEPFQVEHVSAAAMMVRMATVERVGLWDEGYRAYWVETDWCMSVNRAGEHIFCQPHARVVHREQNKRGRRKSPSRIRLFHQGAYRFYRKNYTLGWWDPRALAAAAALGARAILLMTWHAGLGLVEPKPESPDL